MPKKRSNVQFNKPQSSVHPSLSSGSSSNAPSNPKASSVNELIQQSRRTHSASKVSAADALVPTPTLNSIPLATPDVHDNQAPAGQAPLNPRDQMAARRRARRPPGPAPPPSWSSTSGPLDTLYASRHAPLMSPGKQRFSTSPRKQGQFSPVPLVPKQPLPAPHSLQDIALRSIARNWSWHLENDGEWLDVIPAAHKSTLLLYLARLGQVVTNWHLRLLLREEEPDSLDSWEGEPEQALTYLSAGPSIDPQNGISWKQLTALCHKPGTNTTMPSSSTSSTVPESWDSRRLSPDSDRPLAPDLPVSLPGPLHNLTHLSLARTPPPSQYYSALLALLPHLPYLTHLSLSHWDLPPSEVPNSLSQSSSLTRSPRVSALSDQEAPARVLKRVGKAAPRLEWLDLSGTGQWLPTLLREPANEGRARSSRWTSTLTSLRTLKLGPCGCGEEDCALPDVLKAWPEDRMGRLVKGLGEPGVQRPGLEPAEPDALDPYTWWVGLPKSVTATMRVRKLLATRVDGLRLERNIRDGRKEGGGGKVLGCVVDMEGADVGLPTVAGHERENRMAPWTKDLAERWVRGEDIQVGWSWAEYWINTGP